MARPRGSSKGPASDERWEAGAGGGWCSQHPLLSVVAGCRRLPTVPSEVGSQRQRGAPHARRRKPRLPRRRVLLLQSWLLPPVDGLSASRSLRDAQRVSLPRHCRADFQNLAGPELFCLFPCRVSCALSSFRVHALSRSRGPAVHHANSSRRRARRRRPCARPFDGHWVAKTHNDAVKTMDLFKRAPEAFPILLSQLPRNPRSNLYEVASTSDDKTLSLKNLFGLHRGEIREVDFRWE